MAFDCIFVDFQKDTKTKKRVLELFPYARVIPFVSSYFDIVKSYIDEVRTTHCWLISDLVDSKTFDFDFIPEQYEEKQIHVWNTLQQTEGDIMLLPVNEFKKQKNNLRYLRDFKDINYHSNNTIQLHEWPSKKFQFDSIIESVKSQKSRYVNYYYDTKHDIVPSFWEDQKLYIYDVNKLNLLVPKFPIRTELHEYLPKLNMQNQSEKLHFDICYIHNGEPQALENLATLRKYIKDLPNKLHVIENVKGRKQAYQTAAKASETEFFYAVFAKLQVNGNFKFDFVPDTLKSPRHYIFDCYNPVINYTYGHQAIILYNKKLVLENDGKELDFTLAQRHDHIPVLSATTTFHTDPRVCYRTAFREIVKLIYNKHIKPTVENAYVLGKWLDPDIVPGASYVKAAGEDAIDFVRSNNYDFDSIFKSYEWDFVDKKFDSRYS